MTDPVEHLRAAALSTLKGKRRKQVPEKPAPLMPTRPPPSTESFQLDYGLGENNNSDMTTTDKQTSKPPNTQKDQIPPSVNEEGQSREEGEISEEEEPVAMKDIPPIHKISTTSKLATSIVPESIMEAEQNLSQPKVEPILPHKYVSHEGQPLPTPTPTLLERLSEPAYPPTFKQEEDDYSDILMHGVSDLRQEPRFPFGFVDPEHVRPGLALTQAEYDTVKDIILDLLGWGISFNYLIESGISKAVLYYVFSELNLRLPDGFDMSDIIPYTPQTIVHLQQESSIPIPSRSASGQRQPINEEEKGSSMTSLLTRLKTPPRLVTTSAPLSQSPVDSDLHDMERQRRQELIARKAAVQASRRLKQSNHLQPSIAPKPIISEDVTMSSIVPSDTVEDFLKSLEPVEEFKSSQVDVLPKSNQSEGQMKVDSIPVRELVIESLHPSIPSNQSIESPPSSSEPPPTSVESTTTTFSTTSEEALPTSAQTTLPARAPLRRGTKRPVASDFVDFDSSPRKHTTLSRIERPNGNNQPSGITRRLKTGASFHNIGVSRRCVIDLSDSEDDGEHYPPGLQPHQRVFEEPAWHSKDIGKRQSLFPSPVPLKPSDSMTPAALAQKELEIRKMRDLIARREEETRLRKLAMAKSQSNSGARTPVTTTNVSTPPLKMEDIDVPIFVAEQPTTNGQPLKNIRDPDSATPPPEKSGELSSEDGNQHSGRVSETSRDDEVPHIPPTVDQHPDLAAERHGTQVRNHPESAPEGQDLLQQQFTTTQGLVDADPIPWPSTQIKPSSTMMTSVLQEQDAKKPDPSQPASFNSDLQPHDKHTTFSVYRSPFDSYPCLRDHPHRMLSEPFSISHDLSTVSSQTIQSSMLFGSQFAYTKPSISPYSSTDFHLPDLRPLKLASTVRLFDPLKRICQYEIPGGGTCRDEHCEDIHLNRLQSVDSLGMVEPRDEDTAQYLFNIMPSSWLKSRQINSPSQIFAALQQVHQRTLNNPLSFEERVAQVLFSIGSPPTP